MTGSPADPLRITLNGASSPETDRLIARLAQEDALGQLLRRDGRMADLGTEGGDVKLDWVDGVEKALSHPDQLAAAETEGAGIVQQGIRHVIWAGMGGSVQTVYALKRMGYLDQPNLSVHPIDSTDPASLNLILDAIGAPGGKRLEEALSRTMMIGVSMGMTSEEPITHLAWFDALLKEHAVPDAGSHIQVMTLPDSYLDQFARPRGSRMVPIQLDAENHTPGRMSAPATRVFIRPISLLMAALGVQHGVRNVLTRGQSLYELSHALSADDRRSLTERDAFVRLAAWLSTRASSSAGAPKLLVFVPPKWEGFVPWLEQLVEESLGKGGKGFLIFYGQSTHAHYGEDCVALRIHVDHFPDPPTAPTGLPVLDLRVPSTSGDPLPRECAGLGGLTALFLGFKKTVAAYGYLQDIVYAGQPAVEAYKKYARDLRESSGPVNLDTGAAGDTDGAHHVTQDDLTLDYSSLARLDHLPDQRFTTPAEVLAAALRPSVILSRQLSTGEAGAQGVSGWLGRAKDTSPSSSANSSPTLRYLDFTWNGELTPEVRAVLDRAKQKLANHVLHIPAKIRTGPSDYHSTEQGETDGPDELVSLRLVARTHDPVAAGAYDDKFLLAQARGTWQAMQEAHRRILFLTLPDTTPPSLAALDHLFKETASRLQ